MKFFQSIRFLSLLPSFLSSAIFALTGLALFFGEIPERADTFTKISLLFLVSFAGGAILSLLISGFIKKSLQNMKREIELFVAPLEKEITPVNIAEIDDFSKLLSTFNVRLRKQLKDLMLEKELLTSLLNGLKEGVMCLDASGTILFVNDSLDTDIIEKHATGSPYFTAVKHSKILELIHENISRNNQSSVKSEEISLQKNDKFFKLRSYPIMLENKLELFLFIIQDDTKEQNIKRMREDFLQNASHELKTPITSIRGYAEMVSSKTNDEPRKSFIQAILRNTERMERLVEDMVTISSIESGAFPFNPEYIDIKKYTEILSMLVNGTLQTKNQKLDVSISSEIDKIYADPILLEHLLLNLIVNASRYSPPETKILLTVERTEHFFEFTVEDEGPGIEEHLKDKIFERFFRIDKNRSRSEGGTGLGLSIVRQITRIHNGDVRVESRKSKPGSAFKVTLPHYKK